jgi:galactokinase
MTGAGFGGCAVALVNESEARTFAATTREEYGRHTQLDARVYVTRPNAGAAVVGGDASA